ncbi:hypothetical protein ANN_10893 [Periplaneta americana]|uniref:Uncharacterized protein n=1 Tax=Periplaneta americana TaxID=6978 RepID=A0ABQ8T3I1_PERAM|nr:hypothetical protein ANN_10893 [Periplaneta americana]
MAGLWRTAMNLFLKDQSREDAMAHEGGVPCFHLGTRMRCRGRYYAPTIFYIRERTEIAKRLNAIIAQVLPFLAQETIRLQSHGWGKPRKKPFNETKGGSERSSGSAAQRVCRLSYIDGSTKRRFVTIDETWIHYYIPETKQQVKELKHSDSPPPKAVQMAGKVMASVFWD